MYKMFLPLTWIMLATAPSGVQGQMRLELQQLLDSPVIGREHPDAKDNKYGFEGGSVIKIDGTYHMFVAELAGDPLWVRLTGALLQRRCSPLEACRDHQGDQRQAAGPDRIALRIGVGADAGLQ